MLYHPFRFESSVIRPLIRSGLVMNSDKHIQGYIQVNDINSKCSALTALSWSSMRKVSHSYHYYHYRLDDHIIPVELGRKLVESAKSANRTIKYVEFDAGRNFFHKYIHRANELPKIVL